MKQVGLKNGDGRRGAKLMIAGGEKNMMGAERAGRQTDRQTQAGAAVLAGVGFFHLLVLDFFHFMMGL